MEAKKLFRRRIHDINRGEVNHCISQLKEPQNQFELKKETTSEILKTIKQAYRKDEDFSFALESLKTLKSVLESQEDKK